ncbi:MAG: UDP-N-acetylmuramoyl-tripeptide-D-alanyl-D-alanine ligase, partial [Parcubacteria group bacterium GW2011_GWC1_43_11b]
MFLIKNLAKKIVAKILCLEARLIIKRYQPKVVGVTGSVGKTSTKDAIAKVLAVKYQVRKSEKSYNSEFGLPLTIIGAKSAWNSSLGWLEIIARGLWVAISGQKYPEWLVLEVGADRPGDIKNVVKWLPIDIGVLTRLPAVPVHIEFFKNKHQYLEEKTSLVKSLTEAGWAILNFDDPVIKDLTDKLKARVISYGHTSEAKILISNEQLYYDNDQLAGLNFKLDYVGDSLPVRLSGIIGRHQIGAAT